MEENVYVPPARSTNHFFIFAGVTAILVIVGITVASIRVSNVNGRTLSQEQSSNSIDASSGDAQTVVEAETDKDQEVGTSMPDLEDTSADDTQEAVASPTNIELQDVAEMPMTESADDAVSEESEPEQPRVIGGYNPDDGSANLVGTLHVHTEPFHDDYVTVASITLDEPFDYVSTYKGESYTVTAHEVFVSRDGMDDYDSWLPLDGQHITVHCESVNEAYHDASFFNVDTMAYGTSLLDVA